MANNGRDVKYLETYMFPRMQDRYDMIKDDLEHMEEKLEELKEEYENISTEVKSIYKLCHCLGQ